MEFRKYYSIISVHLDCTTRVFVCYRISGSAKILQEAKVNLNKLYGETAPLNKMVYELTKSFGTSHTSIRGNAHSGSPSEAIFHQKSIKNSLSDDK